MKIDLAMFALYAAVIGIGVWLWRLLSDSSGVLGTSDDSSSATVVLTDSTDGAAASPIGEWIDEWQEDRKRNLGNGVIDFLQTLGGHG